MIWETEADPIKKAARTVVGLGVAKVAGAGMLFVTQVFVARALTRSDYGAFVTSMAAINLLGVLATFGVNELWLRVFGREGWGALRWLAPTMRLVTLTTTIGVSVALVAGLSGGFSVDVRGFIGWFAWLVPAHAGVALLQSRMKLEERFRTLASLDLAKPVLLLTASAIVLVTGASPMALGISFTVSGILLASLTFPGIRRMRSADFDLRGHPAPRGITPSSPGLIEAAKAAWPFGAAAVLYFVYFQSDLLLLGWIDGTDAAALYGTATAVLRGVYLLPIVIYGSYLAPKLHRWANHDPERFATVHRIGRKAMFGLGLATMLLLVIISPSLVDNLFGQELSDAGPLLQFMSIVAPLRFTSVALGSVMIARGQVSRHVFLQGITAAINVVLTVSLIPAFSYRGAAAATIATEATLLLLLARNIRVGRQPNG
jgi:O-antigen/teichoic acid export membrane protein